MTQQTSVPPEFKSREAFQEHLKQQVLKGRVPVHVGLIMDGNGRWAKERGYSRIRGHQMGARNIKRLVRFADKLGVKHISLYVFSSENWGRPRLEVVGLMKLIRAYVIRERDELHAEGVRFRHLGRRDELPSGLANDLDIAEKLTENNRRLSLNLCLNYGGRAEIVDAVKKIVREGIPPEQIDETTIAKRLYHPDIPDPDLIIRTSGEVRTSNFLLWQSAYSELFVTPIYWPDFDEVEFLIALQHFQSRERRFGKTGEQVRQTKA